MCCPLETTASHGCLCHAEFKGSLSTAVLWFYNDTGFVFAQVIVLQLLDDNSVYALPLQQIEDGFISLPNYLISSVFTGSEYECVW